MPDEVIQIKEEELSSHLSKFKETTDKTDVLLDVDNNLWVSLGVPVKDIGSSNLEIVIPNEPHVFMAHNLWVNDINNENMFLEDVPVIFAHGYRDGDTWKFANGQSIVETVNAYDEYARLNNMPPIECVISCNKDETDNPLGVKVKDISPNKVVAQSVGNYMTFYPGHESEMSTDGRVIMTVGVSNGEFWNIDKLAKVKQTANEVNIIK